MSNIFSFEFEELPLVIFNGIEAAMINGCAEIQYSRNAEWQIESISVEGHQALTPEERAAGKRPWVYVEADPGLSQMIADRLEKQWCGRVQDAINEQLASDREEAAEFRAEMRREDKMMGL